ncbi:MAG: 50S ribosomal protein L22 [Chloroflexi bacterium RBG_13_51_36]|nr:MAG: 50S ribosomal protein L22 [Chloroflexi bacterium RBG_13_51_36]
MKAKAIANDIGISPQKVRLVIDMVRGKKVDEALTVLRFLPSPTAKAVAKVIKSAVANAENNFQMSPAQLRIADIFADKGHTLKRFRPQSRGRISPILKRSSSITVFVTEEEE